LVRRPEGERTLAQSGHRLEYNIKMGIEDMRWEHADLIHLAQAKD
jgi:hypothetical protein